MLQLQAHDNPGFIEIKEGGWVFFGDHEGEEYYVEWDDMSKELRAFLSTFVDDAEDALDEAIGVLQDIVSGGDEGEGED